MRSAFLGRGCVAVAMALAVSASACGHSEDVSSKAKGSTATAVGAAQGSTTSSSPGSLPTSPDATAVGGTQSQPADAAGQAQSTSSTTSGEAPSPDDTGVSKNSRGEPILLDQAALLACANNQIAWVSLQQNKAEEAARYLKIAAQRAAESKTAAVADQADALDAAASSKSPSDTVDRFLAMCSANGFEY